MYDGYKSGKNEKLSPFTVIANIEQLAQDNELWHLLDWMEDKEIDPNTKLEEGEQEEEEA